MKLHLVGLPQTQTTSEYLTCAYTQKVVKFCKMMTTGGWDVRLYSGEFNEAECTEHLQCLSEEERHGWFGDGFDTVLTPFEWEPTADYWRTFSANALIHLLRRVEPRDLILLTSAYPCLPITAAFPFPAHLCVEPFVGYKGVTTNFVAFESYAWMHHVYGREQREVGRNFDAVVPNFFDPDDFYLAPKEDYLLFMGRLVTHKGPHIALDIAQRAGLPLVVAGPGAIEHGEGYVAFDGMRLEGGVRYVGTVGPEERAALMAGARALICPTMYIEPFGGVAVEAMLSGTPVIAPDFGAFTETVAPEVGYRFRLPRDAAASLERLAELQPADIRQHAIDRYSLEAVRPLFEDWFARLDTLWEKGWDS